MANIDLKKLFTCNFKDNPVWSDFADASNEVMSNIVDKPRTELSNIRRSREKESLEIPDISQLYNNARLLGFDYLRTFVSDKDYQRIVDFIGVFRPKSATKQFANFLGFVKNSRFEIIQLWSEDYIDFFDEPQGTIITEGGTWYPTTHVGLSYDFEKFSDVSIEDVQRLFYVLAPIYLVLDNITARIDGETTLYIGAQALGESVYIYGVADETTASADLYSDGVNSSTQHYESGADFSVNYYQDTNFVTGSGDNFVTGEGDNIVAKILIEE